MWHTSLLLKTQFHKENRKIITRSAFYSIIRFFFFISGVTSLRRTQAAWRWCSTSLTFVNRLLLTHISLEILQVKRWNMSGLFLFQCLRVLKPNPGFKASLLVLNGISRCWGFCWCYLIWKGSSEGCKCLCNIQHNFNIKHLIIYPALVLPAPLVLHCHIWSVVLFIITIQINKLPQNKPMFL